jgi:hypothetical protein
MMKVECNMAKWYGKLQYVFQENYASIQNVIWVIFTGMFNKEPCDGVHSCKYSYFIVSSCHVFHKNYALVKNFNEGYFLHSVHCRTLWRPQAQIPGLATYFCPIITY